MFASSSSQLRFLYTNMNEDSIQWTPRKSCVFAFRHLVTCGNARDTFTRKCEIIIHREMGSVALPPHAQPVEKLYLRKQLFSFEKVLYVAASLQVGPILVQDVLTCA